MSAADTARSGILERFQEAPDMARKRLQQKGDLYKQGGWWKLRWREDQRANDGSVRYAWSRPVMIGPCAGAGKFTEKEARRIAWDNFLSRLDQNMHTPQSIMTVAEFVERRFVPEHVAMLKPSGRKHYQSMLPWAIDGVPVKRRSFKGAKKGEPVPEIQRRHGLGTLRLRDVEYGEVQKLVSEAIYRGYSVQTAEHVRNCVSAIFTHAEKKGWFTGRNPAHFVELPEMTRRTPRALTFTELQALLFALRLSHEHEHRRGMRTALGPRQPNDRLHDRRGRLASALPYRRERAVVFEAVGNGQGREAT
jgi:hypothetical protein